MDESALGTDEVSAVDAVALSAAGEAYLLDVREQFEWTAGHATAAHLLPMSVIESRAHEIPADQRVLVVCHSGQRSGRVTEALRRAGYDAANVLGGMLAWRDAGGDIVSDGPGEPRV